ncbi:hypothetical protein [Amycolatopsis nigrescens]|uniref:hypothetical protein n=1 Tax=Amycolatopsis nigrescens TaxID=381445 RepID=UPI0003A27E51|nr:hypothetical protein [Amycolatopsis nigrescens]
MGKHVTRNKQGIALGFAAAFSAAMIFPASAAPGPDPALHGDCAATLHDKDGKPLTLDAGALLGQPGQLDVGLGSESAGGGEDGKPLLSLPVSDTVDALGVNKVPVVNDATTGVCEVAKPTVNGLSDGLQNLTPDDNQPAPPGDEPKPPTPPTPTPPPDNGTPIPPGENPPGEIPPGGDDSLGPVVGGTDGSVEPIIASFPFPGAAIAPLPPLPPAVVAPGVVPPAVAPGVGVPEQPPTVIAQDSGSAEALPAPMNAQDRLPLLLAVLALAIVAAALVRSWMRGRTN